MQSRVAWLALAAVLLPTLVMAQLPTLQEPRTRLRDRYRAPQNSQKLDDNLRKLKSDEPETRLEGIRGLGELNDSKSIEHLLAAANDPDMPIRIKAIDTLGNIKAKEAVPVLIQRLFMRDTDLGTKQHILAALGKIGDTRATQPITDFLARDVDPAVRGNAIFALGELGDEAALPALEAIASDGEQAMLKGLAQEAIRRIQRRPAPSVVLPALAVERRTPGAPATP
jgi:HEAT repeat protein